MNRAVFVVVALVPTVSLAQRATFQGVGHLPGGAQSRAWSVSGDGRVVVGTAVTAEGAAAVRWSVSEGIEALAPEPGWGGPGWKWEARAASLDGAVIVGRGETTARDYVAFRWTRPTGMADLGTLPGLLEARAWDVTPDGLTVVGDSAGRSFRWTAGTGMEQFPPGFQYTHAFGVSADGATIIGMSGASGFRWTEAASQFFEVHEEPHAVSHDGSVFVGLDSSCPCAIRWEDGIGFVSMQQPPGSDDWAASDVSADGAVTVGWAYGSIGPEAIVWESVMSARRVRDVLVDDYGLDLTGWTLTFARGVSADGTVIVGWGENPAGQEEGWVARLGNGPCYADCDASGQIDFFDFLCFQEAFAAGEPWADCDGSGELDVFDFLCFQNAFVAGCP